MHKRNGDDASKSNSNLTFEDDSKKHILIIAYHVLPYTKLWGAAQRMHYLATHLVENNYKVSIIGADHGCKNYSGKTLNYETFGVKIKPKFLQKYQESFQRSNISEINKIDKKRKFSIFKKLRPLLKSLYLSFERFFFNDFAHNGFICFFWERQAKQLILSQISQNNTKTVIISGPYFGTFKLAERIRKKHKNIKIILDYRDPWNLLKKRSSKLTLTKEKKYLNLADKIVMFSDMFKNDMIKKFSIPKEDCITVYNGFDSDLWDQMQDDKAKSQSIATQNRFVISYVSSNISFKDGTPRDPRNLIKAVSMLDSPENISLNIVGCVNKPSRDDYKFDLNLSPFIPHKEALKAMQVSNVLVILSTENTTNKYTLTGKLFDCIRSGNFVLGIANSYNVNYCNMIEELKIGSVCFNEVSEIFSILNKEYINWKQKKGNTKFDIDKNKYSRRNQNINLISKINESLQSEQ